jgi:hypothetical protein
MDRNPYALGGQKRVIKKPSDNKKPLLIAAFYC